MLSHQFITPAVSIVKVSPDKSTLFFQSRDRQPGIFTANIVQVDPDVAGFERVSLPTEQYLQLFDFNGEIMVAQRADSGTLLQAYHDNGSIKNTWRFDFSANYMSVSSTKQLVFREFAPNWASLQANMDASYTEVFHTIDTDAMALTSSHTIELPGFAFIRAVFYAL